MSDSTTEVLKFLMNLTSLKAGFKMVLFFLLYVMVGPFLEEQVRVIDLFQENKDFIVFIAVCGLSILLVEICYKIIYLIQKTIVKNKSLQKFLIIFPSLTMRQQIILLECIDGKKIDTGGDSSDEILMLLKENYLMPIAKIVKHEYFLETNPKIIKRLCLLWEKELTSKIESFPYIDDLLGILSNEKDSIKEECLMGLSAYSTFFRVEKENREGEPKGVWLYIEENVEKHLQSFLEKKYKKSFKVELFIPDCKISNSD